MEVPGRILSGLSLLFGLLTLVKSPAGVAGGALWLPKLWAGAWAPFLALAGLTGALFAGLSAEYFGVLAGLFGAGLGIRHTAIVTRNHTSLFAQAFGPDWADRIPKNIRAR